jgi:16S rRNA (guanine1207-N2)-methyltransferase
MLHSSLLAEKVSLAIDDRVLVLNSAADAFVREAARCIPTGELLLAEDNITTLQEAFSVLERERLSPTLSVRHLPFHEYTLHAPPATMQVAVLNLLYQPANAWMEYALQLAAYALAPGSRLYVQGAKDRGILTQAKRMAELFGNVETLEIHKGERLICSTQQAGTQREPDRSLVPTLLPFAEGKLDEGTQLLLDALEVFRTDVALDLGCGAGYLGCHIASRATKGQVTLVDASLAAVDAARRMIEQRNLHNALAVPSDGTQAVREQRFDLVVTNPPFHLGGIQTTEVAKRFIREAAQVLRPRGRFYLVANRFLKYEPTMREVFATVEEVSGNPRFKVLRGTLHKSLDREIPLW